MFTLFMCIDIINVKLLQGMNNSQWHLIFSNKVINAIQISAHHN